MRGCHSNGRYGNRGFFFPGMLLLLFLLFMSFKWMPWSLILLFVFVIPMMKRMFSENDWGDWDWDNPEKRKNGEYEKPKRGESFQTYDGDTLIITDEDGTTYV